MRIEQLQYLVDLSFTGSINSSATRLFVTPPAISDAIQKLEGELGVQLLVRSRKGVQLTAAGEAVVADSEKILSQIEALKHHAIKAFFSGSSDLNGNLVLGATPLSNNWIMPEPINFFMNINPNIHFTIYDDSLKNIDTALLQDKIDIAFINRTIYPNKDVENKLREHMITDARYISKRYYHEPMIGIKRGNISDFKKMSFYDFVESPLITAFSGKAEKNEQDILLPNITHKSSSLPIFRHAILEQNYSSLLPLSSIDSIFTKNELSSLQIIHFNEPIIMEYYHLVRIDKVLHAEAIAFLEFISLFFKQKKE